MGETLRGSLCREANRKCNLSFNGKGVPTQRKDRLRRSSASGDAESKIDGWEAVVP